ncbi:unnamed protein product [Allacma fusca]|uniref:Vacuolar protein sorting-associated protein 13A n=1 Tax=Allacma fusca TaxID=39272 RepID=A0A8J2K9Q5_9HEXA|nr:unnamed protein product [Allacma fusca]
MVFETIVVDTLNRLLGDYFENLDTSQLKLGIWGGDVVLRNLRFRDSALEDVGPFKVVAGKLGSLTMKIPWTSLYTAPVILNLQELYLLVMPSHSIKYDEEAEEKATLYKKQKEIQRIENARLRKLAKREGPSKAEDDNFMDKLTAQIIKNVQIKIESIHIRYEDITSNPSSPFCFGVLLKSLAVVTTNPEWKSQIITEAVHIVHKLADLNGLSLYWNSGSDIFNAKGVSADDILLRMKQFIHQENISYVLGPIMAEAKLKLVPNPERGEQPFSLPRMWINVVIQELALGLTDRQSQDLMHLVESLDYMTKSQYYRKYRPAVKEYKDNSKHWWKFAYRCVVEEEVRRRRQNWDWNHLKQHRKLCKAYANAYYEKKIAKKPKPDIEATVAHCEKVLDIFNITLVRKQVEVKLARRGATVQPTEKKGGWMSWSGWFGRSEEQQGTAATSGSQRTAQKIEEAFTPAEKKKLYGVIDYNEDALPLDYPKEFEEYVLDFQLNQLKLIIKEDSQTSNYTHIIDLVVRGLLASISTRPVKSGIRVSVDLEDIFSKGIAKKGRDAPYILKTKKHAGINGKLLTMRFQNHPLDKNVDQEIVVKAQPVEISYHAKTIQELVKCFALPRKIQLSGLQAAVVTTLEEWRLQLASGLQHMLDRRGVVEIDVEMIAPILIIPQDGTLDKVGSVLVVNLGAIQGNSKPRDKSASVKQQGFEEMKRQSYDKFYLTLRDFQIILALPGEDYKACLGNYQLPESHQRNYDDKPIYLINSRELVVLIEQSLITDDPQFERLKVEARLPLLDVTITENRLLELITLLLTLPIPQSKTEFDTRIIMKVKDDPTINESAAISKITYSDSVLKKKSCGTDLMEFTEMMITLGVECFKVMITRNVKQKLVPLTALELNRLETRLISRTFSTGVEAAIGGISVEAFEHTYPSLDGPMYILKTPLTEGIETYLLKVKLFSITPNCPKHLASNIKQQIHANISQLDIVLHLQALKRLIEFSYDCTNKITSAMHKETVDLSAVSASSNRHGPSRSQVSRIEATRRAVAKKHNDPKDILLQLDAHLEQLTVQFSSETLDLVKVVLSKLDVNFKQQAKQSLMTLTLTNLNVLNLSPDSVYKHLVSIDADKVMYIHILMLEEATIGEHYLDMDRFDMKITLETGSPKIIYLSPVVTDILTFIDAFQTAKDAVIEASSAAADLARENIEQVYSRSSRVLLDCTLRAPRIFIPRNEKTMDALLADLGNMTLKNVFKKETVEDFTEVAIKDELHLNLFNVKVSRVLLDSSEKIISEVSVLDPLSMSLEITRNVSSDWYTRIPPISINGQMESCFMRLSNEDFASVLAVSSENLTAPGKLPKVIVLKQTVTRRQSISKPKVTQPSSKINVGTRTRTSQSDSKFKKIPEEPVEPLVEFKMALSIDNLSMILYNNSSQHTIRTGLLPRSFENAFAEFTVNSILLTQNSRSNGDMNADITIGDISLEDCRPGNRAITNLIQRKNEFDTLMGDSIVRVSFKTDGTNKVGPSLVVETTSLVIVLCVDYLVQLSGFFTSVPSETPSKKIVAKQEVAQLHPGSRGDAPRASKVVRQEMESSGYEKNLVNSKMYFSMAETEIILVEDMDTVHANALLLNCGISVKMVSNEEKSNMMGTIGNIKLSTCNYDPENRYQKMAEIISPVSITMVMNSSNDAGTLIALNISNVFIRLTAGTLELLLKISSGITASSRTQEASQVESNYQYLWNVRNLDELDFWFMKPDVTVEVGNDIFQQEQEIRSPRIIDLSESVVRERLILESGCIIITFEAGGGESTIPLLLLESEIDFQVLDWSTKLSVAGRMKLEAAYYNTNYGLWEFLIEPIETRHRGKVSHQPWEMLFECNTVPDHIEERLCESGNYMGVKLQSNDVLEMTVSKQALDVLSILNEEFQAASKSLISERDNITSPYIIVNNLGTHLQLDLKDSPFVCYRQGVSYEEAILNHGTSVNLGFVESFDMTKHYSSVLREQEGREERLLKISVPLFNFTAEIPVNRAEKRYYPLLKKTEFGESYGILCDIAVKDCSKVLTLRGIVQIINELPLSVDIFALQEAGSTLKLVGTVGEKGTYNVPLGFLYTKRSELFFAPKGYKIAPLPCAWTVLMKEIKSINYLKSERQNKGHSFFMKVVGEVKQTLFESTNRRTLASKCCYIYLRPPFVINNLLPVPIGYFTEDDKTLRVAEHGSVVACTNIHVTETREFKFILKIEQYQGHSWSTQVEMQKNTAELTSWDFVTGDKKHTMCVGIHKEIVDETNLILHVYSPFWMINRTGLDLYYQGDIKEQHPTIIHHKSESTHPVMFSFKGKAFFAKNKAYVKFKCSDWSEKFSLDVAGSSGTVTCRSPHREYQVGLDINLMRWGLTKAIIFTPRFFLINQCSYSICIQETQKYKTEHGGTIIELPPKSCLSFWPNLADPYINVNIKDTMEKTKLFRYDHAHNTLLQLFNKYGGVHVDVHVTEKSTTITFGEFVVGHPPALLVNATPDCPIEFCEKGVASGDRILLPGCCQYVAWEDPMGERTLEWGPLTAWQKNSTTNKLRQDGTGRCTYVNERNEETSCFWISFLDGLQRVLLFTDDEELAKYLQAARETDQVLSECVIMFHGLGLSLVDGDKGQEILYMRIASSDIAWQATKPGKTKRFEPLPLNESHSIEVAYQNYLDEKSIYANNAKSQLTLDSGMEVNFATSSILKPNYKEMKRVFQSGVWIHYKNYPHAKYFHAKLYRIQIDNQLMDSVFHVVLAPVAPPKSISAQNEPLKPFAEVSVMQRITAHSSVTQYKYFKVLVQEFSIRADIGFINAVVDVFFQNVKMKQAAEYFKKDLKKYCTPVEEIFARQITTQGQKHFYDFLHFSPLKIHLSFSMEGTTLSNNFLKLLLQSVGVTLTEVQDVVFKLACLELQNEILSRDQLYKELYSHYKSQAIKQLYVLVLGLNVIGNPYGLVLGVTEGVEAFFYEPFQGAIQGPGEFAEGLVLGSKSLLGHTVGGAAGALSKITGTLGKGIAALTLDEEFKQKRREMLTKRPHDVGEAFARSGKGLVMGFFDGVTGVVTQPIKGAQDDGVEGFFKGLGKGAVGLFLRPATGIVDFTSGSLDAVKRATSISDDIKRLRPPRHIPTDSVITPYVRHEAEEMQHLQVSSARQTRNLTAIARRGSDRGSSSGS